MDAAEFSSVDGDGGSFAHGIDGDCDSPLPIVCVREIYCCSDGSATVR